MRSQNIVHCVVTLDARAQPRMLTSLLFMMIMSIWRSGSRTRRLECKCTLRSPPPCSTNEIRMPDNRRSCSRLVNKLYCMSCSPFGFRGDETRRSHICNNCRLGSANARKRDETTVRERTRRVAAIISLARMQRFVHEPPDRRRKTLGGETVKS